MKSHRGQKEVVQHFSNAKDKNSESKILYPAKMALRNEGKIKTFSEVGKLKNCYQQTYTKRIVKGNSLNRMEETKRNNLGASERMKQYSKQYMVK